jgi:DNA-binding transcriptional ArsR family regulator
MGTNVTASLGWVADTMPMPPAPSVIATAAPMAAQRVVMIDMVSSEFVGRFDHGGMALQADRPNSLDGDCHVDADSAAFAALNGLRRNTLAHICIVMYVRSMPSDLAVLVVIAEPTRRRILDAVRGGERSVTELVDAVGMHQPGVSRHLKVLRDAGLVEVRRDAQRRLYRLRAEPLRELDEWLEPYRAELAGRLDSLERHLERTARPISPKERSQ